MMTYNVTDKFFSADAGCFERRLMMDVQLLLDKCGTKCTVIIPVLGNGSAVQQAFKKLSNLSIEMIASTWSV